MFDWNDLRHLIAVSRHGSTLAAATALGVNQSTVHRRIAELESRLGLTLVKRHPTGYRLSYGVRLIESRGMGFPGWPGGFIVCSDHQRR